MCTTTLNNLKDNLDGYINAAICDEKVHIVTEKGSVVLVSEEFLRCLEETIYLQNIPGMTEKIIDGLKTPIEDTVSVDWKSELN